jgi:hypothetical protein
VLLMSHYWLILIIPASAAVGAAGVTLFYFGRLKGWW